MGDARLHDDHGIPEFKVEEHDDGTYTATHRGTGETVTARTWASLRNLATARRIAISLRGPERRS